MVERMWRSLGWVCELRAKRGFGHPCNTFYREEFLLEEKHESPEHDCGPQ